MLRKLLSLRPISIDLAAFLLRITFAGLLIFSHGYTKWILFSESTDSFPDPLGIGSSTSFYLVIFAEMVCAGLVLVGLFTRFALIPMLITMVVAILKIHQNSDVSEMELAILYFAVYASIFLLGPGKYSLDAVFFGKNES